MNIDALRSRWFALFAATADSDTLEPGFSDLVARYSEKHRHYHTLRHIAACLDHLDQVREIASDHFCLETAIWFHDVIYNPKSNNNEQLSARTARNFLATTRVDERTTGKIDHFIRLTSHPSTPRSQDEKLLIDIDLSILGASPESFELYDRQIRKEYHFIPEFLYKRKRKAILNGFLERGTIYQSDWFFARCEDNARSNIKRALRVLDGH